jgi:phosphoesterase RecJ-like protein
VAPDGSLTVQAAEAIYTGIMTDTGGFRHSNTTPAVLRTASLLLAQGARLKKIVQNVATTKTLPALRLWGVALTRVRRHPTLPVVTSVVRREDMVRCQAGPEDLGGVVNLINSIPGAQVAVLLTELSDCEIKVSLRTETEVIDVSRIATLFGGGGHRKAAGFRIRGRVVEQNGRWEIVSDSPLVQDRAEQPLSLGFTSPTPGVEAGR